MLNPIISNSKSNDNRLGKVEILQKQINDAQKGIMAKLNADSNLRDMIEDTQNSSQKMFKECLFELDGLGRKVGDITQQLSTHEDKMARFNEDKRIFELSRDQL